MKACLIPSSCLLRCNGQVHRLSAAEGVQLYGNAFKNYEYFTAKHLDATEVTVVYSHEAQLRRVVVRCSRLRSKII